jgi:uncharacterized protein (TIGR03118 family)
MQSGAILPSNKSAGTLALAKRTSEGGSSMLIQHPLYRFAKVACAIVLLSAPRLLFADSFVQTNLVSNVPGLATTTDPNLKNPWGVSFAATSPFWVSDQGAGVSTLYNGAGAITPLVVTIPKGATPPSGPTGQVVNNSGGTGFQVNNTPASFIFDTLNGTIAAWNGSAGTTAVQTAATPGAVYTGLAMASSAGSSYLYAADSTGHIRVFDSNWKDVTGTAFAGKFVDPTPIAGFVPFNIQTIGSNIYVTYAALTPMGTGLPGGYIDVYDTSGNFLKRFATSGALSAPWGLTLAPATFGSFSNDLLVGNFGNGEILAYDPITAAYLGILTGTNGLPLDNAFLWSLETRTGGPGIDPNAVYFTAGIDNQQDGLFGKITSAVPEPATIFETTSGLIALALMRFRRR